ncbi:hypothetical protein SAMN05428961_10494 [Paenibacillus sp. OK060]|nr:hypothetical protein SAMN05428961_10494 [Paenibacillus sp. OK060]
MSISAVIHEPQNDFEKSFLFQLQQKLFLRIDGHPQLKY